MMALQFGTGISWATILDVLVSFLVWSTVVCGLISIVRDRMEADPFHQHHPLDTHSPTPGGVCVVEHRLCSGCSVRTCPPAAGPVAHQTVES